MQTFNFFEERLMNNKMESKIRVEMCAAYIHLLQFKMQSHFKAAKASLRTSNAGTSELIQKEGRLRFLKYILLHLPFWTLLVVGKLER